MYKVFVVGCGGTGAKTMAFMMDQLKQTLAENAPNWWADHKGKLPSAWQFVSVDSPIKPESVGKNLPNVAEAGGTYISCGSSAGYQDVRASVTKAFGQDSNLGMLANWGLKDRSLDALDVSKGAGQYRGVGRMLVLQRLSEVNNQLMQAWENMNSTSANGEMATLAAELGHQNRQLDSPVVFVISSMAGGSGASMAIDVCRLVSGFKGVLPAAVGLYAITPDVFTHGHDLKADAFVGTNPNSMGMFAEMAAGQAGAGTSVDESTYRSLGVQTNVGPIPVGRIFPVGRTVGMAPNTHAIGDGSPEQIYRSLGLGLASMMVDHEAMKNYVAHIMGNPASKNYPEYGWGAAQSDHVPWGTFGYGRLTMGRERYAEYAAQRLARSAVEHIDHGYFDPSNPQLGNEAQQLDQMVQQNWDTFRESVSAFLPSIPNTGAYKDVEDWVDKQFGRALEGWKNQWRDELQRSLPSIVGQVPSVWSTEVVNVVGNISYGIMQKISAGSRKDRPFYQDLEQWASAQGIQQKLLRRVEKEIARYGVAYADKLLERLKAYLEGPMRLAFRSQHSSYNFTLGKQPWEIAEVDPNKKIKASGGIEEKILHVAEYRLWELGRSYLISQIGELTQSFTHEFLEPLRQVISTERADLVHEMSLKTDKELGVSRLETNVPALWPREDEAVVDPRFSPPATEASLTPIDTFQGQFRADIETSNPDGKREAGDFNNVLKSAVSAVVQGKWDTAADPTPAPEDMFTVVDDMYWIPALLNIDPVSGELRNVQAPQFRLKLRSADVLDRSRKFIHRKGSSFETFISESLLSYATNQGTNLAESSARTTRIEEKFIEAMKLALPLAEVNKTVLDALEPDGRIEYDFVITEVPFAGQTLEASLTQAVKLSFNDSLSQSSLQNLENSFTTNQTVREINFTSSFKKLPPVVFKGVLAQSAEQWAKSDPNDQKSFWTMRRARPLSAALPMSDLERQAMIAGWFVGEITGRLNHRETVDYEADQKKIQVLDERRGSDTSHRWLTFPHPLLTPPSRLGHIRNLLPAVLESSTLAWAQADQNRALSSVQPYLALRGLWDDSPQPTQWFTNEIGASGISNPTLGQELLRDWLYSGHRENERLIAIPNTEAGVDPDTRYKATREYLEKQLKNARKFSPKGGTNNGLILDNDGDTFGNISDPRLAERLPLFADLAVDYTVVMEMLIKTLDWAKQVGSRNANYVSEPSTTADVPAPVDDNPFGLEE